MPTPRKTIIAALHATDLRGQVLPARVPTECLLIIRDGEPVEPVVTRSPLRYHYRHRPEITLTKGAILPSLPRMHPPTSRRSSFVWRRMV